MENISKIIIFSDGSSSGNPGPGGWGAIVSMPDGSVVEIGGAKKYTTNNRMELTGAIKALQFVGKSFGEIILNTDSSYLINGITKWIYGWRKNNWKNSAKKPVLNRDLWEELMEASKGKNIIWNHVAGHAGIAGNERCDEIATSFAYGKFPRLFCGKIADYGIKNI